MLRDLQTTPRPPSDFCIGSRRMSLWPDLGRSALLALFCVLASQVEGAIAYFTVDVDPPNSRVGVPFQARIVPHLSDGSVAPLSVDSPQVRLLSRGPAPSVLITEAGRSPLTQGVVVKNLGRDPVDLGEWGIVLRSGDRKLNDDFTFVVPPGSALLPGQTAAVIGATRPARAAVDFEWLLRVGFATSGEFQLPVSVQEYCLVDKQGQVVDSVFIGENPMPSRLAAFEPCSWDGLPVSVFLGVSSLSNAVYSRVSRSDHDRAGDWQATLINPSPLAPGVLSSNVVAPFEPAWRAGNAEALSVVPDGPGWLVSLVAAEPFSEARLSVDDLAGAGGQSASFPIRPLPEMVISGKPEVMEGESVTLTLRLPEPNAGDLSVHWTSDAAERCQFEAQGKFVMGESESSLLIKTVKHPETEGPQVVSIRAHVDGYADALFALTVLEGEWPALSWSGPDLVQGSGIPRAMVGTLTLSTPLRYPATLRIDSDDPARISVWPKQCVVAPGVASIPVILQGSPADGSQIPRSIGLDARISRGPFVHSALTWVGSWRSNLVVRFQNTVLTEGVDALLQPGEVGLSEPWGSDLQVALSSAGGSSFEVPSSVLIPKGQTSTVFNARFVDDSRPADSRNFDVQAAASGFLPGKATIQVFDNDPLRFEWTSLSGVHPQVGRLFSVSVEALDRLGRTLTTFNETADLYLQNGSGARSLLGQGLLRFTNGMGLASFQVTRPFFDGFLVLSNASGRSSRGLALPTEDPGVDAWRFADVVGSGRSTTVWGGVIQQGDILTNRIVKVDSSTRVVTPVAELRSQPMRMALSSDESFLFIATKTNGILRLDVRSGAVDFLGPYLSNKLSMTSRVIDLAVVPGRPDWLLVASAMTGVRLYKQGQSAPLVQPMSERSLPSERALFVLSAQDAYVVRSAALIQHVRLSDQGVESLEMIPLLIAGRPSDIDRFQIYDTTGGATFWGDLTKHHSLAASGVALALQGAGLVSYAGGDDATLTISVFERDGYRPRGSWSTGVVSDPPAKLFATGPGSLGVLGTSGRLYPWVADSLPVKPADAPAFGTALSPQIARSGEPMILALSITNANPGLLERLTVQTAVEGMEIRDTEVTQGEIAVTNGWMTWTISNLPSDSRVSARGVVVPAFEGQVRIVSRCYPGGLNDSMVESSAWGEVASGTNASLARSFQILANDFVADPKHHRIWFSAQNVASSTTNAVVDLDLDTLRWGSPISLPADVPGLLALSEDGQALWTVTSSGTRVARIDTLTRSWVTNSQVTTSIIRQIESLPGPGHSFLTLDMAGNVTAVIDGVPGAVAFNGGERLNSLAVPDAIGGLINEWRAYLDRTDVDSLSTLRIVPGAVTRISRLDSSSIGLGSVPMAFANGRLATPFGILWDPATSQIAGRLEVFGVRAVAGDTQEGRFYYLMEGVPDRGRFTLEAFEAGGLKSLGSVAVDLEPGEFLARFRSFGNGDVGVLSSQGHFHLIAARGLNGVAPDADIQITGPSNVVAVAEAIPTSFHFTLQNLSQRTAQDVTCRVVLPQGGQWLSASRDGSFYVVDPNANEWVVRIPSLRSVQTVSLEGAVRLPPGTRTAIVAQLQHAGKDPNPNNNEFSITYQSEGYLGRVLDVSWSGAGHVARMGETNQTVLTLSNRSDTVLSDLDIRFGLARGSFVNGSSDGVEISTGEGQLTLFLPALLPSEVRKVVLNTAFPSAGDSALSFVAGLGRNASSLLQLKQNYPFLIEPGVAAGTRPAMSDVVSAAFAPLESLVWVQFRSLSNCVYRVEPISAHLTPGICLDAPIQSWCVAEGGAELHVVHADPLRLRRVRMADGQTLGEQPLAGPFAPGDTAVSLLGMVGTMPGSLLVRFEARNLASPAVLRVYDQGIPRPSDAVLSAAIGAGGGEVRLNPDSTSEIVAFHFTEAARRLDLIRLSPAGLAVAKSFVDLPTTRRSATQPGEDFAISGSWILFSSGLWLQWQEGTMRTNAAPAGGPLIVRNQGTQVLMTPLRGVDLVASTFPSGDSDWAIRYSLPGMEALGPRPRFFTAGDATLGVLHERPGQLRFVNDLPLGPASADLGLVLETDRKSRSPADLFKLSWRVDNRKGWDVRGFELSVVVPPGLRWVPTAAPVSPFTYQLDGDRLIGRYSGRVREKEGVGDGLSFAPVESGGVFNFTASISAAVPDPNLENNTRSLEILQPPLAEVRFLSRTVSEGDLSRPEPASFVTATVKGFASLPIEMDLVAVDGSALAGRDYLFPSQRVSFKPGITDAYSSSLKLDLTILGNLKRESDRTFYLRVVNITNAVAPSDLIPVTIRDDDPLALVVSDISVPEGGADHGMIEVPISLSQPMSIPIEVGYSVVEGTALAGPDYLATSGRLVLPAGITRGSVKVRLVDDRLFEIPETFRVVVDDRPASVTQVKSGLVTILDDDPRPELRILSIQRAGFVTAVEFFTAPDRGYVVEQSKDLASPQWSVISGPIPGSGSVVRVEIPSESGQPMAFLRIRETASR